MDKFELDNYILKEILFNLNEAKKNSDNADDEPKQISKWFEKYFTLKTQYIKCGGDSVGMDYYISNDGDYAVYFPAQKYTGEMRFFFEHKINKFRKVGHTTVGFSDAEQKWYGWSHRAIHGFGIGDKSVECYPGETKKGKTCKTLEDCKQAAAKFGQSVS